MTGVVQLIEAQAAVCEATKSASAMTEIYPMGADPADVFTGWPITGGW